MTDSRKKRFVVFVIAIIVIILGIKVCRNYINDIYFFWCEIIFLHSSASVKMWSKASGAGTNLHP